MRNAYLDRNTTFLACFKNGLGLFLILVTFTLNASAQMMSEAETRFNAVDATEGFSLFDSTSLQTVFKAMQAFPRAIQTEEALEKLRIHSKILFISCLLSDGNLKFTDLVTKKEVVFNRYHLANIVKKKEGSGVEALVVLDPRFEKEPVALAEYLRQLRETQVIFDPWSPQNGGLLHRTCDWMLLNSSEVKDAIKTLIH